MHGRRGLLIAASGVILWVVGGAVVYYLIGNCSMVPRMDADGAIFEHTACPWNFAQAFYFSVQTGLSIGFGLLSESKLESHAYGCFHILMGSSVISGALAFFASLALSRAHHFQSVRERKYLRHLREAHVGKSVTDGNKNSESTDTTNIYEGITMEDLREMMVLHPHYAEVIIHKCVAAKEEAKKQIKEFKEADAVKRKTLATAILQLAADTVPEFQDKSASMKDLLVLDDQTASPVRRFTRWCRHHRNFLSALFAFIFYIAMGTIFSVTADDNEFITGVYFAISTLSTAGMVAVKTVDSNAHVLFTAFFALTGIPVYCTFLGMFANLLVDRYQKKQMQEAMEAKFTLSEVAYLDHLSGHQNDTINFAEFAEIQLLRMGLVDRDLIRSLRSQFQKLDKDGTGHIKKSDFLHPHVLEKATAAAAPSSA